MTPCPYSRKFLNGVLFVCTLEANHKGNHLTWKASRKAQAAELERLTTELAP